jgi:signal recognition particle GTPase
MINYDLSESIKLGTLTGFISGMIFSVIMTFILYFMRKVRFTHREKKHHKKTLVHKKTNGPIIKKYILLMNKEMAFEVARDAIIDQHIGNGISKDSNKEQGNITVNTAGQTIKIHILALTKDTAEITIKADLYDDRVKNIIKYMVTKELDTKRKDISKDEFEDMLLETDVNSKLVDRLLETLPETINKTQAFTSLMSVFQYTSDIKKNKTKPYTQNNLSEEPKKMTHVANKAFDAAANKKILILDGTQESSSIDQVQTFNTMTDIDGIIITKLDSTAKSGSVLNIADELKIPIYYIGTEEQPKNLIRFEADKYVNTILDKIFI